MKKEKTPDVHFAKAIPYNNEPWLTDFTFGQRGAKLHGHMTISGAQIQYLRDEQGVDIIIDGNVIKSIPEPEEKK